jgi:hypothetical protein
MGKFQVLIDETLHSWDKETITAAEVRELGGLPSDSPVLKVDLTTNDEQPFGEDEVHKLVPLDPGKPVVKKIGFKRG